MSAEVETFYGQLRTYAVALQEQFGSEYEALGDKSEMFQEIKDNDALLELMLEKETLVSHLEASKENVGGKIDDKEGDIIRAINDDWKLTETRIQEEQQRRNRNIVEEILQQCSDFRDGIESEFRRLRGEDE